MVCWALITSPRTSTSAVTSLGISSFGRVSCGSKAAGSPVGVSPQNMALSRFDRSCCRSASRASASGEGFLKGPPLSQRASASCSASSVGLQSPIGPGTCRSLERSVSAFRRLPKVRPYCFPLVLTNRSRLLGYLIPARGSHFLAVI